MCQCGNQSPIGFWPQVPQLDHLIVCCPYIKLSSHKPRSPLHTLTFTALSLAPLWVLDSTTLTISSCYLQKSNDAKKSILSPNLKCFVKGAVVVSLYITHRKCINWTSAHIII